MKKFLVALALVSTVNIECAGFLNSLNLSKRLGLVRPGKELYEYNLNPFVEQTYADNHSENSRENRKKNMEDAFNHGLNNKLQKDQNVFGKYLIIESDDHIVTNTIELSSYKPALASAFFGIITYKTVDFLGNILLKKVINEDYMNKTAASLFVGKVLIGFAAKSMLSNYLQKENTNVLKKHLNEVNTKKQ